MNANQAKAILEKYRAGESTPEEKRIVEQWWAQLVATGEWQWSDEERMQLQQAMKRSLLEKINSQDRGEVRRVLFLRPAYWWVAASLLLVLGTGAYFFTYSGRGRAHRLPSSSRCW